MAILNEKTRARSIQEKRNQTVEYGLKIQVSMRLHKNYGYNSKMPIPPTTPHNALK